MNQYGDQSNKKSAKSEKNVKHALLIFSFLLNDLSLVELSHSEQADKRFQK